MVYGISMVMRTEQYLEYIPEEPNEKRLVEYTVSRSRYIIEAIRDFRGPFIPVRELQLVKNKPLVEEIRYLISLFDELERLMILLYHTHHIEEVENIKRQLDKIYEEKPDVLNWLNQPNKGKHIEIEYRSKLIIQADKIRENINNGSPWYKGISKLPTYWEFYFLEWGLNKQNVFIMPSTKTARKYIKDIDAYSDKFNKLLKEKREIDAPEALALY